MARPREELAARLTRIEAVAVDGVVKSEHMTRRDREVLVQGGWLSSICRGWYLLRTPGARDGDSTAWYGSIRSFVRVYLTERFQEGWCLSAASSLAAHAGSTNIPEQMVVITGSGGAMNLPLPHDTSLFLYPDPARLPGDVDLRGGLRVMKLPEALLRVPDVWFRTHESDAAIALRMVRSPVEVARTALESGPVDGVGRLIGAWRALGNNEAADLVLRAVDEAGYSLVEKNPFESPPPRFEGRPVSPYAARVAEMWARMRGGVATAWPGPPAAVGAKEYLDDLDGRAERDAWHSLSIEGYRVTPELIAAVRSGGGAFTELAQRDTLAAAGYMRAQHAVRTSISAVLAGEPAAEVTRRDLDVWYREMFSPHVDAGLLQRTQLLGYRGQPVYIRGSRHVPPPHDAVVDAMDELFLQLREEQLASVRAVLGHFIFTWIHPYSDGNGRLGRFLMNVQLSSAGYPWTVVRMERRARYMAALETASVEGDISPFEALIRGEINTVL
jgi:hypothetical protein